LYTRARAHTHTHGRCFIATHRRHAPITDPFRLAGSDPATPSLPPSARSSASLPSLTRGGAAVRAGEERAEDRRAE
jgi:hypothetical protein